MIRLNKVLSVAGLLLFSNSTSKKAFPLGLSSRELIFGYRLVIRIEAFEQERGCLLKPVAEAERVMPADSSGEGMAFHASRGNIT